MIISLILLYYRNIEQFIDRAFNIICTKYRRSKWIKFEGASIFIPEWI
jgi:hypothetical protein